MAKYLFQVAYSAEGWKKLMAKPQNRMEALQPVLKKLGGKMESAWFAFGEHDVIGVLDLPDNVAAGAFAVAVAGGGIVKSIKTTPLISIEDGIEIMKKAAKCGYSAPK